MVATAYSGTFTQSYPSLAPYFASNDGVTTVFGGGPAVELSSTSTTAGASEFTPTAALLLNEITSLSSMYYAQTGSCSGGAPRFEIALSGYSSDLYVWSGSPTGTWFSPGCTSGTWTSTPNLADLLSTYAVVSGGPFGGGQGTWSTLLSDSCGGPTCGSLAVLSVSLVVDAGWSSNQNFYFNTITINTANTNYVFPPAASSGSVPEFPLGFVALIAVAIPALLFVKSRSIRNLPKV
jgi:hypothetical protein